jgi:ribose 5-phosphate isomerase B
MKIFFAGDHAGFELKTKLIPFVRSLGHEVEDLGPFTFDANDDFPDFVAPLARKVAGDQGSFGIIVAASGQGEAMCANRFKGVRAAVYYGPIFLMQTDAGGKVLDLIASTRQHNNANVLSLGARFMNEDEAKKAVQLWLATPFLGEERHVRRIKKIDTMSV